VQFAVVVRNAASKGVHWQLLDDLRKNELADVHGGASKNPGAGYFEDSCGDSNR
jgi:hypothetical protein